MSAFDQASLDGHKKYQGKLAVVSVVPVETKDDLSTWYTPGVAAPCREIARDPDKAYDYTWKWRTVAVVSDGTAVLGLGNIGGLAWLPVMEWKALLMKAFANIDGIPLVLDTQDPERIIDVVEAIAPSFGAINLEDIKAPECFYIEEELNKRLSIPVFHDDQHGTAIVVLAGLINALKVVEKDPTDTKVAIIWSGAAGIAVADLLHAYGIGEISVVDSRGIVVVWRESMNKYKERVAAYNTSGVTGSMDDAIRWADVVVGVSQPDIITQVHVRSMADQPIVFALSNPDPEITRDSALEAGAAVYASGRSDFPNQINNVLVFPWLLRGALQARVPEITMEHKKQCGIALAAMIKQPTPEMIIPLALDKGAADVMTTVFTG